MSIRHLLHSRPRPRHVRVLIVASIFACVLGGSGCERPRESDADGSAAAPRHPGGSGSARLTYQPSVRTMERQAGLDALLGVSSDGSTLVFDAGAEGTDTMAVGDVVLIKEVLARRVIAVQRNAEHVAVLTVPAALTEIVSDAQIRLHAPIRFGATAVADTRPGPPPLQLLADGLVGTAHAQSPVEARAAAAARKGRNDAYGNLVKKPFKAMLDGWETEFSVEPRPGRLDIKLKMKKTAANVAAVVTGEGYLADFDFDAGIDVERSTVEQMQVAYRKLNGVMNFRWDIQTTDDGSLRGNARMKLPAAIEIPLGQYLAGLPLFLEISSAVLIKPGIGSEYSFSQGAFRVTYDGHQSFSAKQGVVDADGQVQGDIALTNADNGSGPPTGLVLTFAAPRIELSIGVSKVFKFEDSKAAAELADRYLGELVTRTFGAKALADLKDSAMGQVTAGKIVEAAMGSDGAAFVELVTSTGMSHTGSAVLTPCTRTDLHMAVKVGASAKAFGQSIGDADKEIFRKDVTRVRPSNNSLCNNL